LLKPSAALALSMILYELATNAGKHGALSTPTGRVIVEWGLTGNEQSRVLRLTWREIGGPPASQPPDHGFGLTLIERSVGYELDGEVRLDFAPEGLSCELVIPYTEQNFRI
jgi:two-component sensor histidine kinase